MEMAHNQAGWVMHAVYRALSGADSCVLQSAMVDMAGCNGCSFIEQQVQLQRCMYTFGSWSGSWTTLTAGLTGGVYEPTSLCARDVCLSVCMGDG